MKPLSHYKGIFAEKDIFRLNYMVGDVLTIVYHVHIFELEMIMIKEL